VKYSQIAWDYANQVIDGEIEACVYVKQACQRQIDDLLNPPVGFDQETEEEIIYSFDVERAERICIFLSYCQHVKGKLRGQRIKLEPWQIFILTTVFGWVDQHGNRRFKTAYVEVPRKNAKSTLSSGVALYCLSADSEGGAEVYSAATTRDQAGITWKDAKRMVEGSPRLREKFGIDTSAHSIFCGESDSYFKALSRDQGGNLDGLNVHCAVIDELHAHKTREVFDVIETATGAREQLLLWLITTAGFNRAGICYEQRAYLLKILNGSHKDEEYFGIVYTLDEGDDWTDPEVWKKANPNWGVSVKPSDVARKARKAMNMASAQNNFLTKHINLWVNADSAWLDMKALERCADETLDIADFEGEKSFGGLDLASKIDIASKVYIVERDDKIYCFDRHFLPEDTIETSQNSQYEGWAIDGHLVATDGNVIDYDLIEEEILEDSDLVRLAELGFDPHQATQLSSHMVAEGVPMVEVPQSVKNLSEPMKELEALIISGRFVYNGNPVLTWMFSNVVCHLDAKDNIYPRKEFPENKIDGVVALLIAINRWMADEDHGHAYEERGFLSL
jgi:phage terminase large subunit-like protein